MKNLRNILNERTKKVGNRIHAGLGDYLTKDVDVKKGMKRMAYAGLGALMMLSPTINLCCGSEKGTNSQRTHVSDDDSVSSSGDDDSFYNEGDDSENNSNMINVVEKNDSNYNWACHDWACDCVDDYFQFIVKSRDFSIPITEDQLQKELRDIDAGKVELYDTPLSPEELKSLLVTKLNISFLMDEIDSRELQVITLNEQETSSFKRTDFIFKDHYAGEFPVIFLQPRDSAKSPAIIAMHGHGDNAEIFMKDRYGEEYPSHGYSIFMPTTRVMCGGSSEGILSRDFLLEGFASFMTVRMYETFLVEKYARFRSAKYKDIDPKNIGLIGHSGGASLSNLTARVMTSFGAYVSDNSSTYHRSLEERKYEDNYFDDMVPGIYPLHLLINNFSTSVVPATHVEYGFVDSSTGKSLMPEVFVFFDTYLKD